MMFIWLAEMEMYDREWETGSKYLEYNPGSELNIFLMNNEQWK